MRCIIKEERTLPFYYCYNILYNWIILMINYFELNIISIAFWFCYISNTLITIFINKHWKISAHAMGVCRSICSLKFVLWVVTFDICDNCCICWMVKNKIEMSYICASCCRSIISVYFNVFSNGFDCQIFYRLE